MKKELEEKLAKEFPRQFAGRDKDIRVSLMGFGCECNDGWYELIHHVCQLVEVLKAPVEWVQIKEKFGGLSMYLRWTEETHPLVGDVVFHIVDTAESKSYRICEQCGDTKTAKLEIENGWWRTECEECKVKRKAERSW